MRLAGLTVFLTALAWGGEFVVLENGQRLYADRHEREGAVVRLFAYGGMSEFDASRVVAVEREETVEAAAPAEPETAAAPVPRTARDLVDEAAHRHGLPAGFVRSVVTAESGWNPAAISPKGAIGYMQLMPGTARALGADPHDPAQNIEAGVAYLRALLVQYNGDTARALAAYNAGPGAVSRYGGVPPYRETRTYVQRVLREFQKTAAARETHAAR